MSDLERGQPVPLGDKNLLFLSEKIGIVNLCVKGELGTSCLRQVHPGFVFFHCPRSHWCNIHSKEPLKSVEQEIEESLKEYGDDATIIAVPSGPYVIPCSKEKI